MEDNYVDNMPHTDVSGGYMMDAEGYCLGREFLDRDPGPVRMNSSSKSSGIASC